MSPNTPVPTNRTAFIRALSSAIDKQIPWWEEHYPTVETSLRLSIKETINTITKGGIRPDEIAAMKERFAEKYTKAKTQSPNSHDGKVTRTVWPTIKQFHELIDMLLPFIMAGTPIPKKNLDRASAPWATGYLDEWYVDPDSLEDTTHPRFFDESGAPERVDNFMKK